MNKIFLFLGFILLLSSACRKDIDKFTPYGSSALELARLLEQVPEPNTETFFSFSGGIPDTFLTTSNGVRLHIENAENLFVNQNGNPVPASGCLDLKIRVKEYIKGGDILAANIPLAVANNQKPEITTGLVELEFLCGGTPLEIKPGEVIKIDIPSEHLNSSSQPSDNLFLYYAVKDADGQVVDWSASGKKQYYSNWPINGDTTYAYELSFEKTGLAGGFELPAGVGKVCADLPDYYTAENTLSFLFLKNSKTSLQMDFDEAAKMFCIEDIPLGIDAEIVTVSKLGDQWQYDAQTTMTGSNAVVQMQQQNQEQQEILNALRSF